LVGRGSDSKVESDIGMERNGRKVRLTLPVVLG